jgi:prolyl 4-hydroxylase
MEEASHAPYIVLYHDVFSDAEIETLLEIARPKQAKALVGLENSYASDVDRVAQLSWLYDGHHEILKTLNPRFEDMTGLTMQEPFSEALQIQNYGVGGQYYAHHDHDGGRQDAESEDRIATLMLYVSFFLMIWGGLKKLVDLNLLLGSCQTWRKEAQLSSHT